MNKFASSSLRNFDPNAISNNTLSLTEYLEKTTVIRPPAKNDIRYIKHDPQNRRQKYDGCRWRLACTWSEYPCENLAYTNLLCPKHNAQSLKKATRKKSRKSSAPLLPLPKSSSSLNDFFSPIVYFSTTILGVEHLTCIDRNVDDDVEIIDILQPTKHLEQQTPPKSMVIDQTCHPIASTESESLLKKDSIHFNQFSIDFETDAFSTSDTKSEPQVWN